ncbi:hypothetical protein QQX98_006591 [Neonectria punicea]|uniref:Uncharacterized protein n=1 Tax=Neonectria punicea TaxID=979145 RepID=A0ABR1H0F3_9HYPO
MAPCPSFITLPPELRNKIYEEYFVVEGGYIFDFESGKLTVANGHRIHLGLVSTCKFIASETQYSLERAKRLLIPDVWCIQPIFMEALFGGSLTTIVRLSHTLFGFSDAFMAWNMSKKFPAFNNKTARALNVLDLCRVPWAFPTKAHLHRMVRELGNCESLQPLNGRQYRFTAASITIRFLDSISANARLRIRNIVVQEDRRAGAYPECHAQGLIPFCQENKFLRIERRVNLWRTIFQEPDMDWWDYSYSFFSSDSPGEYLKQKLTPKLREPLGHWLFEALGLLDDGMPPDSFTLVLDGDPAPELTTEIFQAAIHRDITWERAFKAAYDRNILPAPQYYTFDEGPFIQAMQHLVDKTSIIRCNFDPGEPWDFEKIIEQARGWDSEKWRRSFGNCRPTHFETTPPLPKWSDLLLDNFDPEWRKYWTANG